MYDYKAPTQSFPLATHPGYKSYWDNNIVAEDGSDTQILAAELNSLQLVTDGTVNRSSIVAATMAGINNSTSLKFEYREFNGKIDTFLKAQIELNKELAKLEASALQCTSHPLFLLFTLSRALVSCQRS